MSESGGTRYPAEWQRKAIWAAVSALAISFLIFVFVATVWIMANVISFLQPILIPVAIAAILAYLLDPVVTRMAANGLGRTKSIMLLFAIAGLALVAIGTWLVPAIGMQSSNLVKELPQYTVKARDKIVDAIYRYERTFGSTDKTRAKATSGIVNWLLGSTPAPIPKPSPKPTATAAPEEALPIPSSSATPPLEEIAPAPSKLTEAERGRLQELVEKQLPNLEKQLPNVSEKIWAIIKKSIGGLLGVTGFLLSLILVCWILAVLIAVAQWGDFSHRLLVTLIFVVVQNLEGLFYAPRIVGNSVGLHPMTVFVSIFVWGLLIGGLLGPILAVPLTATIKVLLARYVWGERLREEAFEAIEEVPVVAEAEAEAETARA